MADITRDSVMTLNKVGDRVRLLTGIEATEVDNSDLSILMTMAIEWVEEQEGSTYTVNTHDLQDQAVTYYTSYLASIAQNGMGIENLKIGEVFISYGDDDPYGKYLDMARDALLQKNALSITLLFSIKSERNFYFHIRRRKTTTYQQIARYLNWRRI